MEPERDRNEDQESLSGGRLLTQISNALVALHRDHFGRGPGAAKTMISGDMVVCVLSDVYTQVEKTLVRAGKLEHVRKTREVHQQALAAEYCAPIERATHRQVSAFLSVVHFDPDLAVEIFLLAPGD